MATRGREMRRFILWITVILLIFTIGIVLVFTLTSINRINREEREAKQNVIDQIIFYFDQTANASRNLQMKSDFTKNINQEMMREAMAGDFSQVMKFIATILQATYDAEYYIFVADGKPVAMEVKEGVEAPETPTSMPPEGYLILDQVSGKKGTFISIFHATSFPGFGNNQFANFVIDETKEIEALSEIYARERRNMILTQLVLGLVAIGVAIILSTAILRYFTRKYITRPIEEIAQISHQLMEGTYEGEIEVVEESDFADLQRLLRSGQLILKKAEEMVRSMEEKKERE